MDFIKEFIVLRHGYLGVAPRENTNYNHICRVINSKKNLINLIVWLGRSVLP